MKAFFGVLKQELYAYKYHYLILALFVIASGFIRLTPLVQGNFPFLFDHGRDLLEVKKIVVNHKPTLIGPFAGLAGVFHGAIHYYLLAIPFLLTGGNPASPTYFLSFLQLFGIIAIYVLFSKILNRQAALFFAIFFALGIGSLNISQNFWNPNWIPFFSIFWLAAFYSAIFKNPKYIIPALFFAGLITQCELAYGFVLIPVTLICVLLYNRSLLIFRYLYLGLVAYASTFIGHILFDLRHEFLMSKSIINMLKGNDTSLGWPIPFPTRLFYRIEEVQKATVFTLAYNKNLAYVLLGILNLTIIYLLAKKKFSHAKNIIFFLTIPLTYFVVFLAYPRAAWSWYWMGLQVPYYAAVAYALSCLASVSKYVKWSVITLIMVWSVMSLEPAFASKEFLKTEPGIYSNEMRVIRSIYDDAAGKPVSIFVYTPPIYTYHYDYLLWWYTKENRLPPTGQDKSKLFYLILEPNKENQFAQNGWKETVIKEGKTVWTKTYPGNITVERREGKDYQ